MQWSSRSAVAVAFMLLVTATAMAQTREQGPWWPNKQWGAGDQAGGSNWITPEKVLKAIRRKHKGEAPRYGPEAFPEIPWPEPTRVPPPWEGGDGKAAAVPKAGAAT